MGFILGWTASERPDHQDLASSAAVGAAVAGASLTIMKNRTLTILRYSRGRLVKTTLPPFIIAEWNWVGLYC